jgi:hypothetical protein
MGAGGARSRGKDWKVLRVLRLRCGGFGFGELRDDAELLHKTQSIPVDPAFRYLAVREAGDGHPGDVDLLPGWCNPAEIPFMGTPTGPTGHYYFAFGDDVLDRQSNVGESRAVEGRSLLFTLRAPPKIECRSVMMFVVGSKEFGCDRQAFSNTPPGSLVATTGVRYRRRPCPWHSEANARCQADPAQ